MIDWQMVFKSLRLGCCYFSIWTSHTGSWAESCDWPTTKELLFLIYYHITSITALLWAKNPVNMCTSIASPFSFSVYTIYGRLVSLLVCNWGKPVLPELIRNYLLEICVLIIHCRRLIDTHVTAEAIFPVQSIDSCYFLNNGG